MDVALFCTDPLMITGWFAKEEQKVSFLAVFKALFNEQVPHFGACFVSVVVFEANRKRNPGLLRHVYLR